MTSITFGGGPSIEARRGFCNLKEGSQVPGYIGYIHQFKFNDGHTYGDQTHLLALKYPDYNNKNLNLQRQKTDGDLFSYKPSFAKNNLPKSNGANKLTESMIPGYTGYIPSRKFNFSDTYRSECDSCIDDFVGAKNEKLNKNANLIQHVHSQPKHVPIASNQEIKEAIGNKNDLRQSILLNDKREFTEPPIPGYTGHIPKIVPTELGLGSRYHTTTERGLNEFKRDYSRHKSAGSTSNINFLASSSQSNENLNLSGEGPRSSKRLYAKPGMVPKYTGYVHGRKFEFGQTYGNTTRDLPVCSHDLPNFGVYMDINPPKTALC